MSLLTLALDCLTGIDRAFLPSCLIMYFLLEENCGGKTQQSQQCVS